MNKEDILTWLTQLGTGWVGLNEVYDVYEGKDDGHLSFWRDLENWHNSAHITKRHADAKFNPTYAASQHESIEQYRLTKRAIKMLEE